jgi:hypothetical protein
MTIDSLAWTWYHIALKIEAAIDEYLHFDARDLCLYGCTLLLCVFLLCCLGTVGSRSGAEAILS